MASMAVEAVGAVHLLRQQRRSNLRFCNIKTSRLNVNYASLANPTTSSPSLGLSVGDIKERCQKWEWKGLHSISYFASVTDSNTAKPPLLLVHGFGASILHWRRNIGTLAQHYNVYAIDLVGFGASDKPQGFSYTMETWAQLILDFINEVVQNPTVLIGNSLGSLACVIAASDFLPKESTQALVCGLVLLNCSGGMNNKAIVDDWRIRLLLPLFWLIDFLLNQRIICEPTFDEGALDAFVSIVTGPPGPNPVQLMPRIPSPVLVLWGNQDPFTPLDGPVGRYFSSLPSERENVSLYVLEGVGHCPHDDKPDLVHEKLLPWLDQLTALLALQVSNPISFDLPFCLITVS